MKHLLALPERLLSACLLGALCLCLSGCPSQKSSGPRSAPAVPVRTAVAKRVSLPVTQDAVGIVTPLHTVAIKSQVDGVIEQVRFRDGDDVRAGDPLLVLDRRSFEAALGEAQAALDQARAEAAKADADLARTRQLDRSGAVSKEELAQFETAAVSAHAMVAARQAAVDTARLNLGYTQISAPIAGRTSRLAFREGSLVKANDTASLLTINELAPTSVVFSVPENALGAVRSAYPTGIVATATLQDGSAASAQGRVDYLDNTVDPATGTLTLRATFDNADHLLWPGQFVRVRLLLRQQPDAIVIPSDAVQAGQNDSHVFVVKGDQTVAMRVVRLGVTAGAEVAVLSGVEAGETVVTDGQLRLLDGTKVTVAPATATPPHDN